MFHPYLSPAGERSPFTKPSAKAQFIGISMEHTTDHLMRAVYEGIAFSVKNCIDVGKVTPATLHLIGGGSKSPFICQLLADVTGVDVLVLEGEEFGAKGTAIAASVALGLYSSPEHARDRCVHAKKRYTPNPENVEKYNKLYELYAAIYKGMWDVWDLRASIYRDL